ncbi:hypothetical protein X777_06460 [Ooceraea biroi]|uniref:Uncharacterized protein n=1 Tax=Ooceraea biroi TaxID=2015173 RepID=A0A026WEC2_OOCBI|nr:hypothetical protein X777_06460 [Ooceraea biroi]
MYFPVKANRPKNHVTFLYGDDFSRMTHEISHARNLPSHGVPVKFPPSKSVHALIKFLLTDASSASSIANPKDSCNPVADPNHNGSHVVHDGNVPLIANADRREDKHGIVWTRRKSVRRGPGSPHGHRVEPRAPVEDEAGVEVASVWENPSLRASRASLHQQRVQHGRAKGARGVNTVKRT